MYLWQRSITFIAYTYCYTHIPTYAHVPGTPISNFESEPGEMVCARIGAFHPTVSAPSKSFPRCTCRRGCLQGCEPVAPPDYPMKPRAGPARDALYTRYYDIKL